MKSSFSILLLALVVLSGLAERGLAQATRYNFRDPASETGGFTLPAPAGPNGNYFVDDNWFSANASLRFIPDYSIGNGEQSFIENGGTAIVNSAGGVATGQLVMGSATGTSGTVEVQSGGVLASRIGVQVNGNITVGSSAGIGTLRVLPGGTLTAESSLVEGSNTSNMIQVGSLVGAGTATLTSATATLASRTQVFPNAAFSTTAGTTFLSTSNYTSEVTGNGVNGKLSVGASATLGGNLVLNFNSYNPSVGHNWNVVQAASLSGNFSTVTSNATLPYNQALVVSKPSLGGGQTGYNVSVQEVLVLEVNRDTGAATLKHPGTSNIQLDGYFIGSNAGLLKPANWNSWDAGNLFGGDWLATAATANNLGELKPAGDATLSGGNTLNYQFGNVFDPYAGAFGTSNEDIQFSYRRSSDGAQFPGKVVYTGTKFNTLLLQVDPTGTGNAFLRNTSNTTVEIDSYDVRSTAGRLTTSGWNSLDEQNYQGANTWLEVNSTANLIGEVNQSGFTTLAPGASLDLGKLYLGGAQDLSLAFLLRGQSTAAAGKVLYEAFTGTTPILGDYNNNGIVDAADYTLWRNNLNGPSTALQNRDPLNSGNINAGDYTYWKSRFGATSNGAGAGSVASSPVPEPATWLLVALTLGLVSGTRRGTRQSS